MERKIKSYNLWTHRERIIARKYWQGKPLSVSGKMFGISRQRVHQILISLGIFKSTATEPPFNWKERLGEWDYYNLFGLPQRLRKEVFDRDGNVCQYCKGKSGDTRMTIDHIVPKYLNGSHDSINLITACRSCNSKKGKKALIDWIKNEKVKISS